MTIGIWSRAPEVAGLPHSDQQLLDEAWMQWQRKVPRNIERLVYLDGRNKLKDLQVSIPPTLREQLDVVMGWPIKAVSEPANRTILDGILGEDGQEDPMELGSILLDNQFDIELPQAIRSSMAYSCGFASVTPGDTQSGEPPVMMQFHSALHATGLWDRRRRALKAGLLVHEKDKLGRPQHVTLITPEWYWDIWRQEASGTWFVSPWGGRIANRIGRVTLDVMPTEPDLDRPFGRARIDRRVMSITDRAVRTGARLDVHSELFSAMKLIMLGADKHSFEDESGEPVPLWDWYMGRFNALGRDEEGEVPELHQIRAESPEPHIATMRQLASEFSGHTGVPLGSLGVAQANPESADAKNVAREDVVFLVEQQHRVYGHVIRRMFENAVMIRDRTTERPEEAAKMQLLWRRPDRASTGALADAGMKQVTAAELQGTEVGMRLLGIPQPMIRQAIAEKRRNNAASVLDRLTRPEVPAEAVPSPDAAPEDEDQ